MLRITGKIYTGLIDPATTDAVLVSDDGLIAAVGDDAKRGDAREIVLGDRVATPGFIDAHMHLEFIVQQLMHLALDEVRSLDELLERVAGRAKDHPIEKPLIGSAWDEADWPEPTIPTRETLDRVAPDHAVALRRICGHLWVVNSKTLGLIAVRDDLTEAQRERLKAVAADGVLREDDIDLARPLTEPTREELAERLLGAMRHVLTFGATCIHDVGRIAEAAAALDEKTELPCRLVLAVRPAQLDENALAGTSKRFSGRRIHPGPVKLFLDGSIGAQTAAVSDPFSDDPGNTGQLLWDEAELEAAVERYHTAGLQVALHAIGDRAIDQALEVYEHVLARHPREDHRHRIEHLEIVRDEQIERMARLGVIASMQPNFVGRWQGPGGLYAMRLGERRDALNPFRSILDAGVSLAFGSDGMPFGPLYGIRSAMNHATPGQSLSFVEALHAYTLAAAFAGRIDHLTGSVEVGKHADLLILSADPTYHPHPTIANTLLSGRPT